MKPAIFFLLAAALLGGAGTEAARGGEPPLPAGLGGAADSEEPALPPGLFGETESEPPLPSSLERETEEWNREGPGLPFDLAGFADARAGARTQRDPYEKELSLGEVRLQLEAEKGWDRASFRVRSDFLYDPVYDHGTVDLETGRGWLDLRELRGTITPVSFADVRLGRQIVTWGTGDLLFINDMFPKDWQSFFIGRDTEYLKAPSDAAMVSAFSPLVNLDVVYTPCFDADRYIDGSRLSYFNPALGRLAGRDAVVQVERPQTWFSDDETAARLSRTVGEYELAAYGYWGYWKSPAGMDPATGKSTFPPLSVYGASIRGPLGSGIANLEGGWYDSRDDAGGSNPLVRNGELRLLAGYELELAADFNAGFQYYLEHMLNYDAYRDHLMPGEHPRDEARHVLTLRLTRRLLSQNLVLSFFGYWSPSDEDFYLRPNVSYRIDDHWSAEVGGNVFWGVYDWTFFGQFRNDTNVYAAVRCSI